MTDYCLTATGDQYYPEWLKNQQWWVNWVKAHPFDDEGNIDWDAVPTKQPVAPYDRGHAKPTQWNSAMPDDEHPSTDFEEVESWNGLAVDTEVESHERVISDEIGIGIIIPVGGGDEDIVLIDWDDVRRPESGEVHPVVAEAITQLGGYAEISQSGEGVHQFALGEIPGGLSKFLRHIDDEPFVGDDRPMVEMYSSGRLTAMTGRVCEVVADD